MKLLELFQIIDEALLLEAKLDHYRNTFGLKLATKYASNYDTSLDQVADVDVVINTIFNDVVEADPTPQKKFVPWLINLYLAGGMTLREKGREQEQSRTAIKAFVTNVGKLSDKQKNIYAYKSIKDLYDVVDEFIDNPEGLSKAELNRNLAIKMHSDDQAEVVYNSPTIKVVIPKTKAASCYFGKNTKWCTAATESGNLFDTYNKKGSLYIILIKKENTRYQYQPAANDFKDELNDDIDGTELVRRYPELEQALGLEMTQRLTLDNVNRRDLSDVDWKQFDADTIRKFFEHSPHLVLEMPIEDVTKAMWQGAIEGTRDMGDMQSLIKLYSTQYPEPEEYFLSLLIEKNSKLLMSLDNVPTKIAITASQHDMMLAEQLADQDTKQKIDNAKSNPAEIGKSIPSIKSVYDEQGFNLEVIGRMYNALADGYKDRITGYDKSLDMFEILNYPSISSMMSDFGGYNHSAYYAANVWDHHEFDEDGEKQLGWDIDDSLDDEEHIEMVVEAFKKYLNDIDNNLIADEKWNLHAQPEAEDDASAGIKVYTAKEPTIELATQRETMNNKPLLMWDDMFDLKPFNPTPQ